MPFVGLVIAAAASINPSAGIAFFDAAEVGGRDVRLGDVADLSSLPGEIRAPAAQVVVLRFAPGQISIRISTRHLAERARGQMPMLAGYLAQDDRTVTVRRSAISVTPVTAPGCSRLTAPIKAGASPRATDLEPASCGAGVIERAFQFERTSGLARATRDLDAGATVRTLPASALAEIRAGDSVALSANMGPVVVERRVTAVQPAGTDQPVFVRGDDGKVFSADPSDRRAR